MAAQGTGFLRPWEDRETLQQVSKQSGLTSVRKECTEELALIDWHRGKNAVMAGRDNLVPGMDNRALQLMNLLKADDFSYKLWGRSASAGRSGWNRCCWTRWPRSCRRWLPKRTSRC